EFNAVKSDDAVENLYADIGSRHKARRFEIRVQKVEEVSMGGEQA
ncbi:50S ribosomal protein L18a, partial [Candidatus Bathyarchaeota archaeon]